MRPTESPTDTSAAKPASLPGDKAPHASGARRAPVRSALAIALILYWALIFFGTHVSTLPNGLEVFGDKVLHFGGYAGLAGLLTGWRASRGRFGWKTPLVLWVMLAAYGAFDELTQIPVGRNADVADWLTDLGGAACGLGIAALIARWISRRTREPMPPAG